MWIYEKKLEYPVSIKTPNPKLALAIISQLGGPDCSSLRFLPRDTIKTPPQWDGAFFMEHYALKRTFSEL